MASNDQKLKGQISLIQDTGHLKKRPHPLRTSHQQQGPQVWFKSQPRSQHLFLLLAGTKPQPHRQPQEFHTFRRDAILHHLLPRRLGGHHTTVNLRTAPGGVDIHQVRHYCDLGDGEGQFSARLGQSMDAQGIDRNDRIGAPLA